MRTLGIDLAAQPSDTAACVIDWHDRESGSVAPVAITCPRTGYSDHELLELMNGVDAIAIDAPFGWPEFISAHLGAYARDGTWPLRPDDHGPAEWTSRLLYRETDRAVRRLLLSRTPPIKITALSVSSDRIAVCAWRCAALLHQRSRLLGSEFDRLGARNGVYEVYPAAALASWGLPFKGYKPGGAEKSKRARAKREAIVDQLAAATRWLDYDQEPGLRDALIVDDDPLDAFIASLAARAAHLGLTALPGTDDERRLAPSEGWIHVPQPESLAELATPPR
jgi:predicted nuclease with RNAse H fold